MGRVIIDFTPVILHVDMDAFFAAVEIRNNPKLKGKQVMVGGGINERGVVSTCSYEARQYGVKSGMSTAKARRLCPDGVFISAGLRGYIYASARLQEIFESYTPIVEPTSVDEAFMDITGTERLYGGPIELVQAMKTEIWQKLKLTCSVGIAPSKYLAKMASGLNKPDGLTVMDLEKFKKVFYPQPVDALWGIGESTKNSLEKHGIRTVYDLACARPNYLKNIFGKNGFGLSAMSRGIDESEVHTYPEMPHDKSMSHETTLPTDIQDPSLIKATILWLSDKVARRLRKWGYAGKTISVKIRSSDFTTISRSHSLAGLTDRCDVIFQQALRLIPKEYGMKYQVRLLGVKVSHLQKVRGDREVDGDDDIVPSYPDQMELLTDEKEAEVDKLTRVIDTIRDKYGEHSITLAGTLRY